MLRLAITDDDQLGTTTVDFWKRVTQLRDLLAAEDSTKVADECEHDRPLAPENAEANGVPSRIQHVDVFETLGDIHRFSSIDCSAGPLRRHDQTRLLTPAAIRTSSVSAALKPSTTMP